MDRPLGTSNVVVLCDLLVLCLVDNSAKYCGALLIRGRWVVIRNLF